MPTASSRELLFKLARRASLALGLLAAAAVCSLAQSKGRITGTVVSQAKTPIAGVTVVATNQVTRREYRAKSDEKGRYSIKVPTGAYRVRVEAPYATRRKRATYGASTRTR